MYQLLQLNQQVTHKQHKVLTILITTLLINLLVLSSYVSYSQQKIDSSVLTKELDSVLAKHGLKSNGFVVNVISINAAGNSQTAYSITNTNNYFVNQEWQLGDVYKAFILRRIEKLRKDSSITSKVILFGQTNNSNAPIFTRQLKEFLIQSGYDLNHMELMSDASDFDGVNITTTTLEDNKTPCLDIRVGVLRN